MKDASIAKIKVGHAYANSPIAVKYNGGKKCYYCCDNGEYLVYSDLMIATSMAIGLFRGYHVSGRMVQITNY